MVIIEFLQAARERALRLQVEVQQLHSFSSFIRRSPPQEVARWMRQMRGEVEHKQVGISSFDSPWVWSPPKKVYLVFLLLQVAKKENRPKGGQTRSEAAALPRGGPQQGVGDEASTRVQATVTDGPLRAASGHSYLVG